MQQHRQAQRDGQPPLCGIARDAHNPLLFAERLLNLRGGHIPAQLLASREKNRRCASNIEALRQLRVFLQRRIAGFRLLGERGFGHELIPRLGAVFRAPHRARLLG